MTEDIQAPITPQTQPAEEASQPKKSGGILSIFKRFMGTPASTPTPPISPPIQAPTESPQPITPPTEQVK